MKRFVFGAIASFGFSAQPVDAEDWPQWGGPSRDFKLAERELATHWPDNRPPELWRRRLGDGYSAISVVDDVLYTIYRSGEGTEAVIALDGATGKTIWEYEQTAMLWEHHNNTHGPGPHATPLVLGDHVYAVGVNGTLVCLLKKDGARIWKQDIWKELGGNKLNRGYASSPVAYEDKIILPVGGQDLGVVAFDQRTGKVAWESESFANSFSSPTLIDVDDQTQVVAFMARGIVGLDPNSGETLWKHPHRTKYDINAMTPVWGPDNILFISSAYDSGSRAVKLERKDGDTKAVEVWAERKMQVQHGNAIRLRNTIYGSSGDFGPAFLTAIDAPSGKLLSRQRGFGKANFVAAGDQIVFLDEDGKLGISTATGDGLEVHDSVKILDDRAWTVPTLVSTTLYVRTQVEVAAFDLGKQ